MPAARTCDLLVVGSGAGGLSAAVTAACHGLKVIVAEKEPVLGGTTAWSGGWMWAPLNPLARAPASSRTPTRPRTYLRHVLGNNFNAAQVDCLPRGRPADGRLLRGAHRAAVRGRQPHHRHLRHASPAPAPAAAR